MPTDDGKIEIHAFDPNVHEREDFDCGVPRLNNFIRLSARKQQRSDITRVYVAVRAGRRAILGYHSLNAYSFNADELRKLKPKATPPHGELPAIYLSMIAVDIRHSGNRIGSMLLDHAKQRTLRVADAIGAHSMILDVVNDGGEAATAMRTAWYVRHGFQPFPDTPAKMFLLIETIRRTQSEVENPR